ncbi:MAG: hypothetical protein QG572_2010, partial [Pseudomonadota bacterium]|nr:hypothetical protein [Pseudomonadota bacterium]
ARQVIGSPLRARYFLHLIIESSQVGLKNRTRPLLFLIVGNLAELEQFSNDGIWSFGVIML